MLIGELLKVIRESKLTDNDHVLIQADHTDFWDITGLKVGQGPDGEPTLVIDCR